MSQVNPDLTKGPTLDSSQKGESLETNNLLNNSDTVSDIQEKAALTTEVTSVAKEEARTGQEIPVPSPDEIYTRAALSFVRNMKFLNDLINRRSGRDYLISRKGMNRIMNAILSLPADELPVNLPSQEEKAAFAIGQRVIADRYLLTHKHIVDEKKRLQKEREQANVIANNTETNSEVKGETNE
jgi:hypothetical protein